MERLFVYDDYYKTERPLAVQAHFNHIAETHLNSMANDSERLKHAGECNACQHSWYVTIPRNQFVSSTYMRFIPTIFDTEGNQQRLGPTWDVFHEYCVLVSNRFRMDENKQPKKELWKYTNPEELEEARAKAKMEELEQFDSLHFPSHYNKLVPESTIPKLHSKEYKLQTNLIARHYARLETAVKEKAAKEEEERLQKLKEDEEEQSSLEDELMNVSIDSLSSKPPSPTI